MRKHTPLLFSAALCCFNASAVRAQAPEGASSARAATSQKPPQEKVTGIGGFFFKAKDPKALAEWYEKNLGVGRTPTAKGMEPWRQESGATAFQPFPATTKYFGSETQQWMINFRVANLDAMIAQLTAAGIKVEVDPQKYPNGRFALLHDPEGNPIQLWEPEPPK
ncbi:MAG TPA: VOC family protein [Gemmatimonadaceae bacterium]|nr:VOC family protein [Gemmatimonadaceae bacterium]